MKHIFFLFLCMILSANVFAQGDNSDAAAQRKLDQIIKTQQQILEQLQELKTELNVVKIRATT